MPKRPVPAESGDRATRPARPDAVAPRAPLACVQTRHDRHQSRTNHVRRQIQRWLYDEEAGLEGALDKLARDLGVELTDAPPEDHDDPSSTPPR